MNRRNFLILLWLLSIAAFPQWIRSTHRELAAGLWPQAERGCTRAILTLQRCFSARRKMLQKHLFLDKPTDRDVLGGTEGHCWRDWHGSWCLACFGLPGWLRHQPGKIFDILGSHWVYPCVQWDGGFWRHHLPCAAEEGVASSVTAVPSGNVERFLGHN